MKSKVIIMAAGKSTRISEHLGGKHKCLIEYKGESIIFRLARQIIQAGYTDITVVLGYQKESIMEALSLINGISFVENIYYEKDKNIYSLLQAYPEIDCPLLIVESDIILSNSCIPFLRELGDRQEIVWCANGIFQSNQRGAIICSDDKSQVAEVKYVAEYNEAYKNYYKNLGILFISEQLARSYRNFLQEYAAKSWQHYFIEPLMEHLPLFRSIMIDFGYNQAGSFNTQEEFIALLERLNESPSKEIKTQCIQLVSVDSLRHIEDFSRERVDWLLNKIKDEDIWKQPICIDRSIHAIMDGQHRMEAAKRLGLRNVPALLFDYSEVDVWTLRPGQYEVTVEEILSRASSGNIYPYKTAKHEFPIPIPNCEMRLDELR
jgi:choline kinase